MTSVIPEDIIAKIKENKQDHLINQFNRLTDENQRQSLLKQLKDIDFDKVRKNFVRTISRKYTTEADIIEPLSEKDYNDVDADLKLKKEWEGIGMDSIKKGEVAVLLMAGGQGTRLGSKSPKGLYNVGLLSNKTLLQIQAERIIRLQNLVGGGAIIPWYIMTSEHTDVETINFFKSHNYFGLSEKNVIFFTQGEIPSTNFEGKILMENSHSIAMSPNGNGGLYEALVKQKVLEDMERRNVRYIHVYGVDNILVRLGDPIFIGYCISKNAPCGAKAVPKAHPAEAVGVFALKNKTYKMIEYSEIDEAKANQRREDGTLLYNAANIANHFFTLDFLKEIASSYLDELEFHIARKKIPCIDDEGKPVEHKEPNGIKLEMFVFDVFRFSNQLAVLLIHRDQEFSPLKNAPGTKDSNPETCRNETYKLHRKFLEDAGAIVLNGDNGETEIEISPLVTYAGEGLESLKGKTFKCPVHIEKL